VTRTTAILLRRVCAAVRVPSGEEERLPEGIPVYLVQSLGGSFTVQAPTVGGLFRIAAADADALGIDTPAPAGPAKAAAEGPANEEAVWGALKQCYDPEIPVNVVDLGLVYDLTVSPLRAGPSAGGIGSHVTVKMTLTAPGCGMGPAIAADARARILATPGVVSADVQLVWDPPWSADMTSPEGRRILGI
jgi:probable FeS assembly SUF system protein SufT